MSSKLRKALNESPIEDKRLRRAKQNKNPLNRRHDFEVEDQFEVEDTESSSNSLKLTIKMGGQTLGEKSVTKSSIRSLNSISTNETDDNSNDEQLDLSMSFDDEDADEDYGLDEDIVLEEMAEEEPDEEEEWLDALEEGRLHEVDDELKKIRDPKLMTARQRALLENKSLKIKTESMKSSATQEAEKSIGEEVSERKQMQNRRRRQQAEEKKEKDKKQTIDRLLKKKQEMVQKSKKKKTKDTPKITYRNNQNGVFICLPEGLPLEQIMPSVTASRRPTPSTDRVKCARSGCENEKKYLCSKTNEPICSLQCYKEINGIT